MSAWQAIEGQNRGSKMKTDGPKSMTPFYTEAQIAECLGVSTRTVRRWIHDKLLVAHRFNGIVRISAADFAAFLAARRET
jgi:excisionase family DNA binding protein